MAVSAGRAGGPCLVVKETACVATRSSQGALQLHRKVKEINHLLVEVAYGVNIYTVVDNLEQEADVLVSAI